MRLLISTALLVCVSSTTLAHHPDKENQRVHPRIEVIPPLGNALPMSHRRKYNRPSHWMGKIAYHIAPSSQEAMAWHNATHRGYYENKSPRIVTHYFYPKPWEGLRIGPRRPTTQDGDQKTNLNGQAIDDAAEMIPSPAPVEAEIPAAAETTPEATVEETGTEAELTPEIETATEKAAEIEAEIETEIEAEATASPSDLTPPNVDNPAADAIELPLSNEPSAAE